MRLKGFTYHLPDDLDLPAEVGFGIIGDGGLELTISGKRQTVTRDEIQEIIDALVMASHRLAHFERTRDMKFSDEVCAAEESA